KISVKLLATTFFDQKAEGGITQIAVFKFLSWSAAESLLGDHLQQVCVIVILLIRDPLRVVAKSRRVAEQVFHLDTGPFLRNVTIDELVETIVCLSVGMNRETC